MRLIEIHNPSETFDTSSKDFLQWFGDSKIINRDGSPLLVWHGLKTPITHLDKLNKRVLFSPDFHTFDVDKDIEPGAWFSPNRSVAASYGIPAPFYLRAFRPLREESPIEVPPSGYDAVYRTRSSKSALYDAGEIAVFDPNQIRLAFDIKDVVSI
jgi:hypothetical protein